MFKTLLRRISGDYNQKQINKLLPIVAQANVFFAEYESLSDEDFPKKTQEFQERIAAGASLDDILPEAFGLVKQACKKLVGREVEVKGQKYVWDMVPYDVQLVGGIILHQGTIAEMKTGEGKTLVAVAPVYLNALAGKGVHVVTVNDYLASRDSDWMKNVYQFLGLTVGCVTKGTPLHQRREMYQSDITYVENSELGFDFLRDNLVKTIQERNLSRRPLHFAIVDEIDSILIDEARTPLIISEPHNEATEKYIHYAKIVQSLVPCSQKKKVSKGLLHELLNEQSENQEEDGDYYVDEKTKTVALSGNGIAKMETLLGVENLYSDLGYEEIHHIENALRALAVYQIDKEYIVKNGEVLIVDEHTGRTMAGRRFSEGLHQAIEAKEGVNVQRESKTLATITYQNFFKQYTKLAGMTGTATTEGEEFEKIYELSVLEVPTHRPTIRVDKHDKVYFNQQAKWRFVKEYIQFAHTMGQPILIGTSSIHTSEHVSRMLEKDGINHFVLNAKFHEQEAQIVAQAGNYGSVMVATNMAGRGTDIKLQKGLNERLSDNYVQWIQQQIKKNIAVSATVYSSTEYDLTIDALIRGAGLTGQQLAQSEREQVQVGNMLLKIRFSRKQKENSDAYAELTFSPLAQETKAELVEKDFHYGLFILGTEKHESRRIDNQLRGRAGRQGDPGISVFFVALDDLIMKKMGGERIQSMAGLLMSKGDLEALELNQKQFTSSIVRAQKQMEAWHFGIRKHVFDYDSVINKQRQAIYKKRDEILFSEKDMELRTHFVDLTIRDFRAYISGILGHQVHTAKALGQTPLQCLEIMAKTFGFRDREVFVQQFAGHEFATLTDALTVSFLHRFDEQIKGIDQEKLYHVFKDVYLYHVDMLWIEHIDAMEYLRDKVGLMGYAQIDPLIVYKKEAFEKFQQLLLRLRVDVISYLASFDYSLLSGAAVQMMPAEDDLNQRLASASSQVNDFVHQKPSSASKAQIFESNDEFEIIDAGSDTVRVEGSDYASVFEAPTVVSTTDSDKVRPNDPCPCGSGKKYKKCCGA